MSAISIIQIPWQNIDAIQQHPRSQWDEDDVVKQIKPQALKKIAHLFVECGEGDGVHFNFEKWVEHKAAIKKNFEKLRNSLTPIIEETPSLCSLLDIKPHRSEPSSPRLAIPMPSVSQTISRFDLDGENNLSLGQAGPILDLEQIEKIVPPLPPPSPKRPAPMPSNAIIPPAIVEYKDLADLLGYYKALELQIAELEGAEPKIDRTNLVEELARILNIDDILQKRYTLLMLFQIFYDLVFVERDGNCLPRAIVRILQAVNDPTYGQWNNDPEKKIDQELVMAQKLRKNFVEFMRGEEEFIPYISNLPLKDKNYSIEDFAAEFPQQELESKDDYQNRYDRHRYQLCLNELEKDGCFFCTEFIAPLAKMLGYKIHVYAPPLVFVKDNQIVLNENSIFGNGERSLHILHMGEHFWGLKPRQ